VDAHNANISKFFSEYTRAFDELSGYRGSTVHKVFSEPEQMDESRRTNYEQVDETERARFWQLTSSDYERFSTTGKSTARETMLEKCPR
jgi:hypothetical protein